MPDPDIQTDGVGNSSEELIWRALQAQLLPGETVLRNVRFTDPRSGDVEADFLIFFPNAGIAVIEVKGGTVSYENGQWITRSRKYSRRIHPTEQARKAKHALRRYLDRQPEWHHGLVRSEWFVALPYTDVTGDMGPEGRREHLLGRSDIDGIRDRLMGQILNPLNKDAIPKGDWVDEALSLVLRLEKSQNARPNVDRGRKYVWPLIILVALVAAVSSGLATIRGGWLATLTLGIAIAVIFVLLLQVLGRSKTLRSSLWPLVAAASIGLTVGFTVIVGLFGPEAANGECSPNYLPCVPIVDDITCGELKLAVRVIGEDIYQLDRNGDGTGCESYGAIGTYE